MYVKGKVGELQLVPRMTSRPYHVLLAALERGAKPKTLKPWCEERNRSGPDVLPGTKEAHTGNLLTANRNRGNVGDGWEGCVMLWPALVCL